MEFIENAKELIVALSKISKTSLQTYGSNLSNTDINIFMMVEESARLDQQINISEISKRLNISKSAVSQAISKLEKNNYVKRKRYPGDLKNVYVVFSPKGEEALKICQANITEVANDLVTRLGTSDSEELIRIINKIVDIYTIERKVD